jgi:hypothetical protein
MFTTGGRRQFSVGKAIRTEEILYGRDSSMPLPSLVFANPTQFLPSDRATSSPIISIL